jgi:HicB family
MTDEDRYTRITLRIPKDLHARLQAEADASSKSINAEIIGRVQQTFDASSGSVETRLRDIEERLNALGSARPKKGKS